MTTPGSDVTGMNLGPVPAGQLAGYDTGSGGIAWTTAQWAARPGSVHIDQDPAASDGTADVLDVEAGAVPPGSPLIAAWAKKARAAFAAGARPGQRTPAIYQAAANVTATVNALTAAGITSGVGLWVANWNLTSADAVAAVKAAAGPFPVIGVQYSGSGGGGSFDRDEFSTAWLTHVSASPPVPVVTFPLRQGQRDGAPAGPVHTLQANLNKWAHVLGIAAQMPVDGVYGALTATAAQTAAKHLGNGSAAGECDQALYDRLAGPPAPVPGPPAPRPPPPGPPAPGTQNRWRHCTACQGLFYGPGAAASRCPAGGPHTAGVSYSYALPYTST